MNYDKYESPFSTRYASKEMQKIFSQRYKFSTFRKLWTALAKAENILSDGKLVTAEQVAELAAHTEITDVEFEIAEKREKEVRHDVMAHVYAYGKTCPNAAGIIHLGATSCYVGDNTDVIIMRDGLNIVKDKLIAVIKNLAKFADDYKEMPCLAYTHLQPAQPTTVGKRAALWLYDFLLDYKELEFRLSNLALLGQKGTTGTQASFVELFGESENDSKAEQLEKLIATEMGFDKVVPVSGQTYSRKVDSFVLNVLSGIAQSAMKFAGDIRILANFKEIEEPFEKNQIGSSAMPYKRNPMRCERISSISRYIITNSLNPAFTAGSQWFERTLDDSANKRVAVAEGFLALDGVLNLLINVTDGLVVYPKVVAARLEKELPFMASENILMQSVKNGGDRQELHEIIRENAVAAANLIKQEGKQNDLIERFVAEAENSRIPLTKEEIYDIIDPEKFIGRSVTQVKKFLADEIFPIIEQNKNAQPVKAEINV